MNPSTQHRRELPTLELRPSLIGGLLVVAWLTALMAIIRWFVGLYFAILFDDMHKNGSMVDDYAECGASVVQLLLFGMVCWGKCIFTNVFLALALGTQGNNFQALRPPPQGRVAWRFGPYFWQCRVHERQVGTSGLLGEQWGGGTLSFLFRCLNSIFNGPMAFCLGPRLF